MAEESQLDQVPAKIFSTWEPQDDGQTTIVDRLEASEEEGDPSSPDVVSEEEIPPQFGTIATPSPGDTHAVSTPPHGISTSDNGNEIVEAPPELSVLRDHRISNMETPTGPAPTLSFYPSETPALNILRHSIADEDPFLSTPPHVSTPTQGARRKRIFPPNFSDSE